MKCKVAVRVVGVIGILSLFVTMAHAGSGNGTISFSAFFECQGIPAGTNLNEVVTIGDPSLFSQFPIQKAIVGTTTMACKQVQVRDSAGNPFNPAGPPTGNVLKCYSIAVESPAETPTSFTFSDFFLNSETLKVQGSRYLCGTATETQ